MAKKGFVFTIDAMFSLAALSLLAMVYLVVASSHFEATKYSVLENQGRDYLHINYVDSLYLDQKMFNSLTGHNVTPLMTPLVFSFASYTDINYFDPINGSWKWSSDYGGMYKSSDDVPDGNQHTLLDKFAGYDYAFDSVVMYNIKNAIPDPILGVAARSNTNGARYVCIVYSSDQIMLWKATDWLYAYPNGNQIASSAVNPTVANTEYHLWISATGNMVSCGLKDNNGISMGSLSYADSSSPYLFGFPALESFKNSVGGGNTISRYDDVTMTLVQSSQPLQLRSVLYVYPNSCNCKYNCYITLTTDPCLTTQESLDKSLKEAWVS